MLMIALTVTVLLAGMMGYCTGVGPKHCGPSLVKQGLLTDFTEWTERMFGVILKGANIQERNEFRSNQRCS